MEASKCKAAVVVRGRTRGKREGREAGRVDGGGGDWVRRRLQAATEGLDEGETRA